MGSALGQIIASLRTGDWITRERTRLWALALLIAALAGLGYLMVTSDGLNDFKGRPLGTDFSDIYAGGTYVLDGTPGLAFDPPLQHAREQAIFGAATPFFGWCYPPFLLFVAAALALMPYTTALAVWQGSTLLLYLGTLWALLRSVKARPEDAANALSRDPLWLLLAIASPAVFVNLGHGHNGFLTATLIGMALVVLDRRPIVAGILFGLLSYKPQFGVMIPLVLIASARWRAFTSAAATVLVLTIVTTLAFGPDIWRAFLDSMPFTREVVLEQGGTGWYKLQTVFSWVRMWGGSVQLAYAIQGAVTLTLAGALAWLWRSNAAYPLKAAALIIASLLATPYSLDYDFVALAPAIAFIAADGFARGFAPWERTALAFLWLMPLAARTVPEQTLIPLGVPALALALVLVLKRAADDLGLVARWYSVMQPIK
jgi:alpha-1,2-mannosyltransferase